MDQNFLAAWSLSFSDLEFVHGYRHAMRVGLAAQLLHFRSHGYFLTSLDEMPANTMEYLADQVGESIETAPTYDNSSDTSRRHRLDILRFLGIRRATDRDKAALRTKLQSRVAHLGATSEDLVVHGYQ